MTHTLLLVPLVAILGTLAIAWRSTGAPYQRPDGWLVGGRELPEVTLLSDEGRALPLASLQGRWTLLYMGFARCPDACPLALRYMSDEISRLPDPSRVQALFVSIDPERDTPQTIRPFVKYFDPALRGSTAGRSELEALAAGLGTSFRVVKQPGREPFVSHPEFIFVLHPDGRLVARYRPFRARAGDLARAIASLPPVPPPRTLGRSLF